MNVYGRSRFTWVKNSLWFKDTYLLAIVEEPEKKGMFRIVWADDTKSKDYYNKTRAREHSMKSAMHIVNGVEEPEWDT